MSAYKKLKDIRDYLIAGRDLAIDHVDSTRSTISQAGFAKQVIMHLQPAHDAIQLIDQIIALEGRDHPEMAAEYLDCHPKPILATHRRHLA